MQFGDGHLQFGLRVRFEPAMLVQFLRAHDRITARLAQTLEALLLSRARGEHAGHEAYSVPRRFVLGTTKGRVAVEGSPVPVAASSW